MQIFGGRIPIRRFDLGSRQKIAASDIRRYTFRPKIILPLGKPPTV
jgi:hypothetical protein